MFAVWKTVQVGVYKNADEYLSALQAWGVRIGSPRVEEILRSPEMSFSSEVKDVNLVVTDVAGVMGDSFGWYPLRNFGYENFRKRGLTAGLRLCAPEVGFALALCFEPHGVNSHLDCGNSAIIAMEDVLTTSGPLSLSVSKHGDRVGLSVERLTDRSCHQSSVMIFQTA
jgi:hypothetical protein